jgi:hypothetical protein
MASSTRPGLPQCPHAPASLLGHGPAQRHSSSAAARACVLCRCLVGLARQAAQATDPLADALVGSPSSSTSALHGHCRRRSILVSMRPEVPRRLFKDEPLCATPLLNPNPILH